MDILMAQGIVKCHDSVQLLCGFSQGKVLRVDGIAEESTRFWGLEISFCLDRGHSL